ncbi:glycerate kinase [Nocardioides sp. B-3]|uniref:glycerate kinase n=1 Tax=Nocardioides sp. B-3 TaxID=2895565 RepID=UPI00215266D5|nr:glycerate kinase [Nocardioides sp. B-3]UUZ59837.1 glycerate kinase [Nocardioides sp. B-3]
MPKVLIASDKFKGSLTAAEVAAAVSEGVRRSRPDVDVESVPVADGETARWLRPSRPASGSCR